MEDLLVCGFESLCLCRTSFVTGSDDVKVLPTGLRLKSMFVNEDRRAEEGRWGASAVSIMVGVHTAFGKRKVTAPC